MKMGTQAGRWWMALVDPLLARRVSTWRGSAWLAGAVLISTSGTAWGQAAKPSAPLGRMQAERDFSMCRELQKEGDAGSCWKVWLRKHRAIGTEAEVAYAEEHLETREPSTRPTEVEAPDPKASKKSFIKRDASEESRRIREFDSTPAEKPNSPPVVGEAETPDEDVGEGNRQDGQGKSKQRKGKPESAEPSDRLAEVAGGVLDLCGLKPKADATRFVKQRVVLFAPAQSARVESESSIRSVHGGELVRGVFASRFPLGRFHNVITTIAAKPGWDVATSLPLDELREFVESAPVEAAWLDGEGEEAQANAERERDFVRYSLGCADYVVAPNLTNHTAEWVEREVKTKKGTKKIKALDLKLEGSMGIFRREGDRFVLVKNLSASVPSMIDLATDATAGAIPDVDPMAMLDPSKAATAAMKALQLPPYISALPDAACELKKEVADGVPTLGACKDKAVVRPLLSAASIDERASDTCKKAYAEGASDAMSLIATCETRVRAFQLARALQVQARDVDGWKLFAPLEKGTKDDPESPSFSLGRDEGVQTGWGFYAIDGQRNRLAFFKAGDIGPGGDAGKEDRTELVPRFGDAPLGARMEEYPQLGLKLLPWGGVSFLSWNYGASVVGNAVWRMPTTVAGGGAEVGYDLSGLTGLMEFNVRVGGGYLAGLNGENLRLGLVPIDVTFEKGWSAGRLTIFLGVGQSTTLASVDVMKTPQGGEDQSLSATVAGMNSRLGFDLMLTPDVAMRLEGTARIHFNSASYSDSDDEKKVVLNGFDRREDHFATLGPSFVVGVTF
jgi:hypothetical protein